MASSDNAAHELKEMNRRFGALAKAVPKTMAAFHGLMTEATRPGGTGMRRKIPFAKVVLPAPVSPTTPRVCPLIKGRLTEFSAATTPSSVS